jgi:hypothetical protein
MRILFGLLLLTLATTSFAAETDSTKHRSLTEVLEAHKTGWMEIDGVVGVGETEKDHKPAIMIMVEKLTPTLKRKLPKKVDGYVVVIEEVGKVKPLTKGS